MTELPVLPTLKGYQGSWLVPDLVAGLTLVAIAVPEQMATARLANLPPVTGLYAFLAGSILFAILGSNRHMSVGADSTIAPVFAAGVAVVAMPGTAGYSHLVALVALSVGVLLIVAGLLRLGWIADFLPQPVVLGLLTGIGIAIAVRQLPAVLGLPGGGSTTLGRLRVVVDQRNHFHPGPLVIAAAVLLTVVASERINRRVPGALIALVGSTAAVAVFDLKAQGVSVVGHFHRGLPSLGLPSGPGHDVRKLAGTVLTVAFLCIVQIAATARSGETDPEPAAELDRDLVAVGAGNVLAGFSGSFAVNASPPRTAIVEASGGRSQATSLVAAAGVLVVLAVAGLLTDVPEATLGAILIFVASRLVRVRDLRQVLRFDRFEFGLAVITVLVVALVGIEQGVIVAILLALGQRTRLAARPRGVALGREPGTDHWIPDDIGRTTETVPGVLVYLLYAPLWYGNAAYVLARLRQDLDALQPAARALVIDADAMSDIDYTAARLVVEFTDELRQKGIEIGWARTSHLVHHDLKHSGLLDHLGPGHLYLSVQAAVDDLAPT